MTIKDGFEKAVLERVAEHIIGELRAVLVKVFLPSTAVCGVTNWCFRSKERAPFKRAFKFRQLARRRMYNSNCMIISFLGLIVFAIHGFQEMHGLCIRYRSLEELSYYHLPLLVVKISAVRSPKFASLSWLHAGYLSRVLLFSRFGVSFVWWFAQWWVDWSIIEVVTAHS